MNFRIQIHRLKGNIFIHEFMKNLNDNKKINSDLDEYKDIRTTANETITTTPRSRINYHIKPLHESTRM